MNIISNSLLYLDSFLGSAPCIISVFTIALIMKISIIFLLFKKKGFKSIGLSYAFLALSLLSVAICDSSWIVHSLYDLIPNLIGLKLRVFWFRIAWAFFVGQYQFLSLFLESLSTRKFRLTIRHYIMLFVSSVFILIFLGLAIFKVNAFTHEVRPPIEFTMHTIATFYTLLLLMIPSLVIVTVKIKISSIPRILTTQLKILTFAVIMPYWISDMIQAFSFVVSFAWMNSSYTMVTLPNLLLTAGIFYCSRKIMGLRFLNFQGHVQAKPRLSFMNDFKTTLEQLSLVTTLQELQHITHTFFKEGLQIPLSKATLYIRETSNNDDTEGISSNNIHATRYVDMFMSTQDKSTCEFLQHSKVLIYDELEFSNFYEESPERTSALQFLNAINADIFVPIYEKNILIAYIIVDRFARHNQFYSNVERDEILVFVSYLGNIINLIKNKSLDSLIKQDKDLREELYRKHQEINQYKESIRSFMRSNKQKSIGIIFYKNRSFSFANQAAQELVGIDPNRQEGHPVSKALRTVAHAVEQYKSSQSLFTKDADGNTLILSGVPSLERNNVIITISYPEISDILKKQIDTLRDPSEWDYLLYLETTKKGKLINQLIPGSGHNLIAFKIELLKIALSKKAILLDMPDQDLEPTVELLHHISLRETLHVLEVKNDADDQFAIAIMLFGINPLFAKNDAAAPLLEKLNGTGTLFIKNIHRLNKETQRHLAEFIKYGTFRLFKSDQRVTSSVRIICSSNKNLHHLAQEGRFDKELFEELKHTTLAMPSLMTLSENELNTLAEGFSEQVMQSTAFKNLLELTDRDKHKLISKRPASLQELKYKVQYMLVQKSKRSSLDEDTHFDPAYGVSDPDLVQAARLGKYALKDRKMMTLLWEKFRNQNKIAQFLGVNRSSVNRRCKDYELQ